MVKIYRSGNTSVYLSPEAVAEITEAGTASQWHGVRSIIRTFDGRIIEASEDADVLARKFSEAQGAP